MAIWCDKKVLEFLSCLQRYAVLSFKKGGTGFIDDMTDERRFFLKCDVCRRDLVTYGSSE